MGRLRLNYTRGMRRLPRLLAALALAGAIAAPASARTPNQARFHDAFVRMDAQWPNIPSHDYWLALRDAEDLLRRLTPEEIAADPQVQRDVRVIDVYRKCWLALHVKERALAEFLAGQRVLQDTPGRTDDAREHFALSAAALDEAFRLWPFLAREPVRGDVIGTRGEVERGGLVAAGSVWRALVQRHLDAVSPK